MKSLLLKIVVGKFIFFPLVNFINTTCIFSFMKKRGNKRGIVADYLPWLLIGVAILVILMIAIFLLKGKGIDLISSIKNLFRRG